MLASEYGWSIEYIESLDGATTTSLIHAILYRKGVRITKLASQPTGTLANRIAQILDTAQE